MKILHFVSKKNFEDIKRDGFLVPRTPFFQDNEDKKLFGKLPEKFQQMSSGKFICGIPKSRFHSWRNTRFDEELVKYIKPNFVLEFDLTRKEIAFIREHYYTSPRYVRKRFHEKFFRKVKKPIKLKIWKSYLKSSLNQKSLTKYKVPEVWIKSKIPFSKIHVYPSKKYISNV